MIPGIQPDRGRHEDPSPPADPLHRGRRPGESGEAALGRRGQYRTLRPEAAHDRERERILRAPSGGALPDHEIFAQVAMGALLKPIGTRDRSDYYATRGRFAQKIVDFVVCDRATLNPIAIVELDDRTHRPDKDAARDEMLIEAGYRVLRWESRSKPSAGQIAATIRQNLNMVASD